MEQFQLDTILNERMRSGLFRYEVMTESLLFDNSDLINQAASIIQLNEINSSVDNMNIDFIQSLIQRNKQQNDKPQYFLECFYINEQQLLDSIKSPFILQNKQQKLDNIFNQFEQFINCCLVQKSSKGEQKNIEYKNNFVIELDSLNLQQYINFNYQQKQQFIIEKILLDIEYEENFWIRNQHLYDQYQHKIKTDNQFLQQEQNIIMIVIVEKLFNKHDIESYFENQFFLIQQQGKEVLTQDIQENEQIVQPLQELSIIYSNKQILRAIKQLSQNRQNNYPVIQLLLLQYFPKIITDSFSVIQLTLDILNQCEQIVRWQNLLLALLNKKQQNIQITQEQLFKKREYNYTHLVQKVDNLLLQQSLLQQEIQFYSFIDTQQSLTYSQQLRESNNKTIIAYEVLQDGILIFAQFFETNNQQLFFQCDVSFETKKLQSKGILSQFILSEIEIWQCPAKRLAFTISKEYYQTIQFIKKQNIKEQQNLIQDMKQKIIETILKMISLILLKIYKNKEMRDILNEKSVFNPITLGNDSIDIILQNLR